jgi:hypothetical protein
MVHRDGVEELRAHLAGQVRCAFLDQSKPEMDVTEQLALVRRQKERAAVELVHAPDVVKERSSEDEVCAQTRMHASRLAAEGSDVDRVLEQAAGVAVVAVGGRRQPPQALPEPGVAEQGGDRTA